MIKTICKKLMVINSSLNSKGEYVLGWSPYFSKTSDIKICQNLVMFNFRKGSNEVKLPKVELFANMLQSQIGDAEILNAEHETLFYARNVLWAVAIAHLGFQIKKISPRSCWVAHRVRI